MLPRREILEASQVVGEFAAAYGFGRTGEVPAGVADCEPDGLGADVEPGKLAPALRKLGSEFGGGQRCHEASLRAASCRMAPQNRA
jgi:hypothetical protein